VEIERNFEIHGEIEALPISLGSMKYVPSFTWISKDEFTCGNLLGEGSFGKVFRGTYNNKEVAVKSFKESPNRKLLEEFKKEFQVMSALTSDHLVRLFGVANDPKVCLIMEFCAKGSLHNVLNDSKLRIGWKKVIKWAIQITKAVDTLHSSNPQILHRDLKTPNIMVTASDDLKVADFGLSRFNTESSKETLTALRGTRIYCPPEIYLGEQPFDSKSDVYSLSLIFWELSYRSANKKYQQPYGEYEHLIYDFQVMIQASKFKLRPSLPVGPKVPESLRKLISRCWDPNPAVRPECKEIIEILKQTEEEYLVDSWDDFTISSAS